jgi:hypothetical protein
VGILKKDIIAMYWIEDIEDRLEHIRASIERIHELHKQHDNMYCREEIVALKKYVEDLIFNEYQIVKKEDE